MFLQISAITQKVPVLTNLSWNKKNKKKSHINNSKVCAQIIARNRTLSEQWNLPNDEWRLIILFFTLMSSLMVSAPKQTHHNRILPSASPKSWKLIPALLNSLPTFITVEWVESKLPFVTGDEWLWRWLGKGTGFVWTDHWK